MLPAPISVGPLKAGSEEPKKGNTVNLAKLSCAKVLILEIKRDLIVLHRSFGRYLLFGKPRSISATRHLKCVF
jgi:hypothetical protein